MGRDGDFPSAVTTYKKRSEKYDSKSLKAHSHKPTFHK